jgi:hypothetical protein
VHLACGDAALLMRRLGDERGRFAVGETLHLRWPAAALHVLPDDA